MLSRLRPERILFRPGDSAETLGALPGSAKLKVVLSSHLVRLALLPWSDALGSDDEWQAYARHVFGTVYGTDSSAWHIRVCDGGRGKARVACAADASLIDSIAAVERVASIQPHFMTAFNERRGEFGSDPGWFVLHEPGRVAVGLVAGGEWKLVRVRQAGADWREALPALLHRESAAGGFAPCARVVVSTGVAA